AEKSMTDYGTGCRGNQATGVTTHIGGYRTSSATQCKLRCVTGGMVAPCRRSPNRNVYRLSSHSLVAASRTTVMRLPGCINTGRLLVGANSRSQGAAGR